MEKPLEQRRLIFVGSSKKDLQAFPDDVREVVTYALFLAQSGMKHPDAKPLSGEKASRGASVLEVVEDCRSDTYRAVYTVRYKEAVYVLHAFQKKSTQGIKTPKREMDLVKSRLKDAGLIHVQQVRKDR
jgi:phage-related protein